MVAATKLALKKVRKYIVASILKLSGPVGFITGLVLDYVIKNGWIALEAKKEAHQKKEAYDKVKNDPTSTVDDIGKSFHDLINS